MVSLVELSEVTEEGVKFKSPYDGKEILLSPEKSISIQNSLGEEKHNFYQYGVKEVNLPCSFLVAKRPCPCVCVFFQDQTS